MPREINAQENYAGLKTTLGTCAAVGTPNQGQSRTGLCLEELPGWWEGLVVDAWDLVSATDVLQTPQGPGTHRKSRAFVKKDFGGERPS